MKNLIKSLIKDLEPLNNVDAACKEPINNKSANTRPSLDTKVPSTYTSNELDHAQYL